MAGAGDDPVEPPAGRLTVVDSSILINYLGPGRLDLLFVARRLAITAEVDGEVLRNRAALDAAVARGDVTVHALLLDAGEASLVARLTRHLSVPDASSIVLALRLGADLAVGDRSFRREAAAVLSAARILGTEELLAEAVSAGVLSLAEGDHLLGVLPTLRYQPRVGSLREMLTPEET